MILSRVLAVGAHPDDVEFYAGATLAGLAREGADVRIVICTDGSRGGGGGAELAAQRRNEAERAAATLGCARPTFLGYADGELVNDNALRRDLVREIRAARPELLLAHDPTTLWTRSGALARLGHSDHRAAGEAVLDALYPRSLLASFYPELVAQGLAPWIARELWLFDTTAPDHFREIAAMRGLKREALFCHASQNPTGLAGDAELQAEALHEHAGFAAEGFRRLQLY
ncbi:MAG TPA: PIG-L family deacetylase [Myxococcota bacterium]|nr:PIG-L family deacetylase [Myxococcota bacterium]